MSISCSTTRFVAPVSSSFSFLSVNVKPVILETSAVTVFEVEVTSVPLMLTIALCPNVCAAVTSLFPFVKPTTSVKLLVPALTLIKEAPSTADFNTSEPDAASQDAYTFAASLLLI